MKAFDQMDMPAPDTTVMDSMTTASSNYDAVVIGGGPAGSCFAALLAEQGHSVLLLERSPFPRFHVGESLIPETYWALKRLGLLERLKNSEFPRKYSVQFVTDTGKESAPFYFDEYNPHECSVTWQVVRSDFDQLLVDNAREKGADIRVDAQVLDVLFDGDRATGVKVKFGKGEQGTTQEIGAKVVVDATGQSAFLSSRLKLKVSDPLLRKGTVWSYFKGAHRDPGKDEGATIILQTEGKKSWFWYIPLPNDVVSVGCTGEMDYMFGSNRRTPEEIFKEELDRCIGLQRRLENAEWPTEFHTTKDFSYKSSQGAGPGWVLIGDAFGFIDPVYSSGVFLALHSGMVAADAVHEALKADDLSAARLGAWQPEYRQGVENFRKLVLAFYTPGFRFGEFLKMHPQYQSNLVDILIGNVFKPNVGEIFEAMGEVVPAGE
ncbi:MAG: NAD(P)/FAD-dependent oxidoreductase [Planctomycetaceae bacterium]